MSSVIVGIPVNVTWSSRRGFLAETALDPDDARPHGNATLDMPRLQPQRQRGTHIDSTNINPPTSGHPRFGTQWRRGSGICRVSFGSIISDNHLWTAVEARTDAVGKSLNRPVWS